ncbi:MAG: sigma-70 family RNA polymerase sigma factor, partial [Planctomycetaceae bacterium]|nr:sigma-70 family RNA polymerase sigma factor [Planctomycetaceae bacterium]
AAMGDLDTRIGGPAGSFPSTRQSVLEALGDLDARERDRDLERLISLYWKPVYCLIRRTGARSNEDAKDLTQEFFTRVVLQGALPERFTPDKGSFRAYLKTSVRNFLRNEHRDATRLKKGAPLPLEIGDVDLLAVVPDAQALPPDQVFDASWRSVVIGKAVQILQERLAAANKSALFDVFRRYDLEDDGARASYESVGRALGIGPDTVKNHLTRAREEFRKAVRDVVCATIADPKDLTTELQELFGL